MPPEHGFFLSDGQEEPAVHGKRGHRRSTMRGPTHESDTCPRERLIPVLMAGVRERDGFSAVRSKRCLTGSLTQSTRDTGSGQMLSDRLATCPGLLPVSLPLPLFHKGYQRW